MSQGDPFTSSYTALSTKLFPLHDGGDLPSLADIPRPGWVLATAGQQRQIATALPELSRLHESITLSLEHSKLEQACTHACLYMIQLQNAVEQENIK